MKAYSFPTEKAIRFPFDQGRLWYSESVAIAPTSDEGLVTTLTRSPCSLRAWASSASLSGSEPLGPRCADAMTLDLPSSATTCLTCSCPRAWESTSIRSDLGPTLLRTAAASSGPPENLPPSAELLRVATVSMPSDLTSLSVTSA